MVESNLNTGLPKQISFITDKQLRGNKKVQKEDITAVPFEEREFNIKFRQTTKEQLRLARSFREKDDENAGDDRKIMFGLVREHEFDHEARQPGFIKTA